MTKAEKEAEEIMCWAQEAAVEQFDKDKRFSHLTGAHRTRVKWAYIGGFIDGMVWWQEQIHNRKSRKGKGKVTR